MASFSLVVARPALPLRPFACPMIICCAPDCEEAPPYQQGANYGADDKPRNRAAREAVACARATSEKLARFEAGQDLGPSVTRFEDEGADGIARYVTYHSRWQAGAMGSGRCVDSITNPTFSTPRGILPVIREPIF